MVVTGIRATAPENFSETEACFGAYLCAFFAFFFTVLSESIKRTHTFSEKQHNTIVSPPREGIRPWSQNSWS